MGLWRMGPPEELVLRIARELAVPYFVETGTLRGETAAWAAAHFRHVWTIEASEHLYEGARQRHGAHPNIGFILGDSRKELGRVVASLDAPAIFFLDAHWSGGPTHGQHDQCPLLEEVEAVNACA